MDGSSSRRMMRCRMATGYIRNLWQRYPRSHCWIIGLVSVSSLLKAQPMQPTIVIHGSFSNEATWWRPEGSFCRLLDERLNQKGSKAKCWDSISTAGVAYEFGWSGLNSEASRSSITDLRIGVEKRRSSREVQRSIFARFLGLFDFRLLQQYLPQSGHAAVVAGCPLLGVKRTSGS